jgi:hypothetical protein
VTTAASSGETYSASSVARIRLVLRRLLFAAEGRSGDHLEQHAAQREDVAAAVDVAQRSDACSGLMYDGVPSNGVPPVGSSAGARHRARDPEVRDDRVPFLQQDVAGLDVEMDDALTMRVVERERDLAAQSDCLVGREPVLAEQPIAERLASDERRYEVEERRIIRSLGDDFTRVVQRQDVRMR